MLAGALEACCDADAQGAMSVLSSFCSDWFLTHAPALMAAHPAGALAVAGWLVGRDACMVGC